MNRNPTLHLRRKELLGLNRNFISRFLKHVAFPHDHWDQCWPFDSTNSAGYGVIDVKMENGSHTNLYAHRVMYALQYESIDGRVVMHECNQRNCVNPFHLEAGAQLKNIEDAKWYRERNKEFGLSGKNPHFGVLIAPPRGFRFHEVLGLTEANLWVAERELQIIDLVDAA
jgi:hypothetical protein